MKSVTQADIARALGLSQPTVGLVVGNGGKDPRDKLKQETIDRILQKAKEMGYRPHRHAQAMRGTRTTLIGLIHGGGMMQVSNERAYAVSHALKDRGYDLLTLDIYHGDGFDEVVNHMIEARVDGLIIGCWIDPEHLKPVQKRNIPMVGLACNDLPGLSIVRSDMHDGFLRLVDHLHAEGHQRLVQLTPAHAPSCGKKPLKWQQASQIEGFREGLERHGGSHHIGTIDDYASWEPRKPLAGFTLYTPQQYTGTNNFEPFNRGTLVTRDLLESGCPLPEVILAHNDDWAFGSINELLRAGLDVPREITVTGFNDACLSRDFFIPYTTVRQPTRAICEKAVDLLIEKIENTTQEPATTTEQPLVHELPCELVIAPSSLRRTASNSATPLEHLKNTLSKPQPPPPTI